MDDIGKSVVPKKKGDGMTSTMVEYCRLRGMGLNDKEACQITGMKESKELTRAGQWKRENTVKKYSIVTEKNLQLAEKQLQRILSGKGMNIGKDSEGKLKKDYPTQSNILQAISMIIDRVDPIIKKSESTQVKIDLSPVKLEEYELNQEVIEGEVIEPTAD